MIDIVFQKNLRLRVFLNFLFVRGSIMYLLLFQRLLICSVLKNVYLSKYKK